MAFVGAGFSRLAGYPDWLSLLIELGAIAAKKYVTKSTEGHLVVFNEQLKKRATVDAASTLRAIIPHSELNGLVAEVFDRGRVNELPATIRAQISRRYRALIECNWTGVITTNYDCLIEDAYDAIGAEVGVKPLRVGIGDTVRLGTILHGDDNQPFLVKLHGDAPSRVFVLTKDEYDAAYLRSPRNEAFLTAIMLRYNIVFIGCSLTDSVVTLRARLASYFGNQIPPAYALMPEQELTKERSQALQEAEIYPCFFGVENRGANRYRGLDAMIAALSRTIVAADRPMRTLAWLPVERKIALIGIINRDILRWINHLPGLRARIDDLRDRATIKLVVGLTDVRTHAIKEMKVEELAHRLYFLMFLRLLEDTVFNGWRYFKCTRSCGNALRRYQES